MNYDLQAFYSLLRRDLFSFIQRTFRTVSPGTVFVPNWHIEAVAWALSQCYLGEIKRLIITLPPRNLKSISASVALTAWLLGRDPTLRIISASYNRELAERHAGDTRLVMETPWYQATFPRTRLDSRKNTQFEIMTTQRGGRLATSVGGTLTGRGGDFVIIDDAHKADEALSETKRVVVWDWFRTALLSRLDSKQDGRIIVIQQRLHEDDLVGHLLEQEGWTHLNLPAIAETEERIPLSGGRFHVRRVDEPLDSVREPKPVLESIRAQIGSYAFAAQYQQRPTPLGGGIIKLEWFPRYERLPEINEYTKIIQSWDTAFKGGELNDPSVCLTLAVIDNHYYLIDVFCERLEYPDLKRSVVALARKAGASQILIEDTGSGTSLLQELKRETQLGLIARTPEGDKVMRAATVTDMIEAGRVYLPTEALWLADFEHELVSFPNARHDDQVDALSQFLHWQRGRSSGGNSLCVAFPGVMAEYDGSLTYGLGDDLEFYDGSLT